MTVETAIRVRYAETDAMGVAYHAHFFAWFEVGRVEFMRSLGLRYRDLEQEGLYLPVVECSARFLAPAPYDALLGVRTSLLAGSRAKLTFGYQVVDQEKGAQVLALGKTVHAFATREGRPTRLAASHPLWAQLQRISQTKEAILLRSE